MRDRSRPIVTLLIAPDSPLAKGRLPKSTSQEEAGILAVFDPVSYGALRASIGEFIPLLEVQAMFQEAIHKKLGENSVEHAHTQPSEEAPA
jgi:hypothetical protein